MKKRLTSEVILRLTHKNYRSIKNGLEKVLEVSRCTIWRRLGENEWNGDLTKDAVLEYLEDALGMTRNQLLETIGE